MKPETIKSTRRKRRKTLLDIDLSKEFMNKTSKANATKIKINK